MKIIEFDPIYSEKIYSFVQDIKINEMGWNNDSPDLLDIEKIYLFGKGNFWIALDDNKLVGTIALKDMKNGQGFLKRMYITKKYRGTGLSTKLLSTLLDFAKSKNFKEIYLSTTNNAHRAIGFYKKSGFVRIKSLPGNFVHHKDTDFFKMVL